MASQESKLAGTRRAAKAGSWYTADPDILSRQLETWLDDVPDKINGSRLPIPGARVIIAPHAGYSYSGPCAAWAYKALDLSKAERIFVLGPSHTYGLSGCALTTFAQWATPLGDLVVDQDVMDELRATGRFADIPRFNDTEEHSLEMHMPYIYKRLEQTWSDSRPWPTIVPMVVGDGSPSAEKRLGRLLAPYLRDPENAFVISSDFCHWGSDNFRYSMYCTGPDLEGLQTLSKYGPAPTDPPIHEAIRYLDEAAMASIETGIYDRFRANIDLTQNTVCGRHPIGVMMAALEELASKPKGGKMVAVAADAQEAESNEVKPPEMKGTGKFTFVQYRRSNLVEEAIGFSVSYASAYAIV